MLSDCTGQGRERSIEGVKEMKRTEKILLIMLSCVLLGIIGCQKDGTSQETSAKIVDKSEFKIEESLKTISDWRFAHWDDVRRKKTLSTFRNELNRLNDPVRRKNYVKKLAEIVFAYPLDATDPGYEVFYCPLDRNAPGTRKEQWFAFSEMSDMVSSFADPYSDMEYLCEIKLRRLQRLRDETRSVEAYLAGNGDSKAYKGERNRWAAYHKHIQGDYYSSANELSRLVNNILVTHTLSYEKWRDIHSRLEKIVGHEVEIRPSILKLWKEKRKMEQKATAGAAQGANGP